MGLYARHVLPWLVDRGMRGEPIDRRRARLLALARGRVLELGLGTGLNARHYPAAVSELVGVEPNAAMRPLAARRLAAAGREARVEAVSGEALPFPAARFDTVVSTFTLCTIPDLPAALAELRRVLAPGGAFLFLEHNLADDPRDRRWQRWLDPAWRRVGGGCSLLRDIPVFLRDAGFVLDLHEDRLEGSSPVVGTLRWGVAREA